MRAIFARVYFAELIAACRVAAFGDWWAARAARRYGKFSGEYSGPLNSVEDAPGPADDGVAFDWIDRRMGREAK